jgi:hypothetical protein
MNAHILVALGLQLLHGLFKHGQVRVVCLYIFCMLPSPRNASLLMRKDEQDQRRALCDDDPHYAAAYQGPDVQVQSGMISAVPPCSYSGPDVYFACACVLPALGKCVAVSGTGCSDNHAARL